MTENTKPDDPVGLVRQVQAGLRERYNATEVEVNAHENTTWEERHQEGEASSKGRGLEYLSRQIEQVDRDESLTITLRWLHPDIPKGDPERPAVLHHLNHTVDVLEELREEFPMADVSTYANGDRAQVNLTFEEES